MNQIIGSSEQTRRLPREWEAGMSMARKYATSGPRYTSYPTAPQFSEDFDLTRYRNWQGRREHHGDPLSLYVHLPFCHDICYYCGCNKVVTRKEGVAARYLAQLSKELEMQSQIVGKDRPVTQMHWGGGTPTYLNDGEITELMHSLASRFRLLDKGYREYSIEIDPRTVSSATIALLKGVGFNRISLGVQDFDERVQKAVNRIQPYTQVAELVEATRAHGFRSLSFDLIYGLPYQDHVSMAETLRKVISLRPDRIACYNYAHLPERFLPQRSIDRHTLPEPEEKLLLAQMISATLQDAGYRYIGMDHYVLPDDELAKAQGESRLQRNFQGYSLQLADDLLGLGVSSISQIGDFYLQNARDLPAYYQMLEDGQLPITKGYRINNEDKLRRRVIMSLICDLSLDIAEVEREFGIDFRVHFHDALEELNPAFEDRLMEFDAGMLRVTAAGRPFLRNLCMPFDEYLEHHSRSGKAQFSATV
ncbi:oxygen-independent coproporphyrinogen III oxidase [Congregibacter litoralis]|uniref:Coproporphyrinogen-III oxidase n=1 Tax=Congregibacter litoralis KT71 TaxID=314285 RepID=A4A3W0_9GAMM|nr:oxygen-independent coproporphyrinogen III oxidase [Congregibacter litoralis]EAQ99383.1 oxygen-independent coproporphyrinogen III oxidase [Congregibacter litoralis KT71]